MTADENSVITAFEEKPAEPKSTLASMGVYIFTWDKLRKYLIDNENDESASKDFGKNIIPDMLENKELMVAYPFDGYWKDVGTLDSLWEANMDLLNPAIPIDLYDPDWKMYSRSPIMPPQFIGKDAEIDNSMVNDGCEINGKADFSILFDGVTIEQGATVHYSIVMPGSVIKSGAVVEFAIVGENCEVGAGAHVGTKPDAVPFEDWGIAVIGHNITVSDNAKVLPKQIISENI